jgi:hypothetical protein
VCRQVEETFFPDPAVAGILETSYVEARLHTDGQQNAERIGELVRTLARTPATPTYVVIDPRTETEVDRHEGGYLSVQAVADFLSAALKKGGKVARR